MDHEEPTLYSGEVFGWRGLLAVGPLSLVDLLTRRVSTDDR